VGSLSEKKLKNRILTLFGSGETSPHMAKNYRFILDKLDYSLQNNFLLDTPFGFQENNQVLSKKIQDYFSNKINLNLKNLNFINEESYQDKYKVLLSEADFIFSGPGSPTYASRIWLKYNLDKVLKDKLNNGVVMAFASAAALTLGKYVIPVYEIYKVGQNENLNDGLNVLDFLGKDTVIVPHFNNQEGGDHDTSYCFIGKKRFDKLIDGLDVVAIGIEEHTSLTFDLNKSTMDVRGLGNVHFISRDGEFCLKNGESMEIKQINKNYVPKKLSNDIGIDSPKSINNSDIVELSIDSLLEIRRSARESKMYQIADNIRDLLITKGIEIIDNDGKTSWKKLD
tara:strand:- start:2413 stop:3432 length:1020 start_codon:yes stop_codon:yes gene_type:complete